YDITLHEKDGRKWAQFPGRPIPDRDRPRRDQIARTASGVGNLALTSRIRAAIGVRAAAGEPDVSNQATQVFEELRHDVARRARSPPPAATQNTGPTQRKNEEILMQDFDDNADRNTDTATTAVAEADTPTVPPGQKLVDPFAHYAASEGSEVFFEG